MRQSGFRCRGHDRASRRGSRRIAPRLSITGKPPPDGSPYVRSRGCGLAPSVLNDQHEPPLDTLHRIQFRGGFPESLSFLGQPGLAAEFLRKWADVSPLAELDLHGIVASDSRAIDGPHLSGLRALSLGQSNSIGLSAITASPHLPKLEALHLIPDRSNLQWAAEQYRAFASSSLAGRITRLSVELADVTEALALHGAPLRNLTALAVRAGKAQRAGRVRLRRDRDRRSAFAPAPRSRRRVDARRGHFAGAGTDRSDLPRPVAEGGTGDRFVRVRPPPARRPVLTPALTDLTLAVTYCSARWVSSLADAPFVDQFRHLRLDGTLAPNQDGVGAMMQLLRALDANRLETIRIGEQMCPSPSVRAEFAEKFGDRVRFG